MTKGPLLGGQATVFSVKKTLRCFAKELRFTMTGVLSFETGIMGCVLFVNVVLC